MNKAEGFKKWMGERMGHSYQLKVALEAILELENELSLTKDIIVAHQIADETGYIDGVGWVGNWSEMEATVVNLLEAHNLEQQANACDLIIEMATISKLHSPYMIARDSVIDKRDDLRNQAKELKEQGK